MTEITFQAWHLTSLGVTLLVGFLGFVFAAWKIITALRDKRADSATQRAQEAVRKADENEKSILKLRSELPLEYVRRDDWIRNQSIIEAKLDALAAKLDSTRERGDRHGC